MSGDVWKPAQERLTLLGARVVRENHLSEDQWTLCDHQAFRIFCVHPWGEYGRHLLQLQVGPQRKGDEYAPTYLRASVRRNPVDAVPRVERWASALQPPVVLFLAQEVGSSQLGFQALRGGLNLLWSKLSGNSPPPPEDWRRVVEQHRYRDRASAPAYREHGSYYREEAAREAAKRARRTAKRARQRAGAAEGRERRARDQQFRTLREAQRARDQGGPKTSEEVFARAGRLHIAAAESRMPEARQAREQQARESAAALVALNKQQVEGRAKSAAAQVVELVSPEERQRKMQETYLELYGRREALRQEILERALLAPSDPTQALRRAKIKAAKIEERMAELERRIEHGFFKDPAFEEDPYEVVLSPWGRA